MQTAAEFSFNRLTNTMTTAELLIFLFGSLTGAAVTAFFAAVIHTRKVQQLHDEFTSTREVIRRNAYSKGYEDAKTGKIKTA